MMFKKKLFIYSLIIAIGINVSGCADVEQRGYYFSQLDEAEEKIEAGTTTQHEVIALLGSPTTESTFGDSTWYYIGGKSKAVAFFRPEVVDNHILAVTFDEQGIVSQVNKLGKDDMRMVNVVNRSTPTQGKDVNVFQQFINNIGRFEKKEGF